MVDGAAKIDVEIEFANGDTEPEDATIKNELFVSETIDGMTVLQGQFDAEVGETIRTAIDLARRLANGTLDEIDKPTDHEGIETDSNDHVPAEDKIGRIITRGVSETFDVGRLTRAIPAPTAKAVRKRDKCCRFPRCDLSYRYTEVHHYVHWVHGGETNVSNLFLLCWRHHRMIHKRGLEAWTITGNPNTILTFKAPSGDTYKTGPPGLLIPA